MVTPQKLSMGDDQTSKFCLSGFVIYEHKQLQSHLLLLLLKFSAIQFHKLLINGKQQQLQQEEQARDSCAKSTFS